MSQNTAKYYGLLGGFIALYLLSIFYVPPDPARLAYFGLSSGAMQLISLAVNIPYMIIWVIAFYGFTRLKQYTQLIRDTTDGQAMSTLADGHMFLAVSLPLNGLSNAAINYYSRYEPGMIPATVIVKNYLTLALTAIGFLLIARGAKSLHDSMGAGRAKRHHSPLIIILVGLIGAAYVFMILHNPSRQISADPSIRAAYYLPDLLIISTLVLPYLYVWYLGIRSTQDILEYQSKTQGLLYSAFLKSLAAGVSWVAVSTILLQFFTAMHNTIMRLRLKSLLIIVYLLLACIAIGYVKIARGAHNLRKIEEV